MDVLVIKKSHVRLVTEANVLMTKYFEEFFEKLKYSKRLRLQDITTQFKSADLIIHVKRGKEVGLFSILVEIDIE